MLVTINNVNHQRRTIKPFNSVPAIWHELITGYIAECRNLQRKYMPVILGVKYKYQ